MNKFKHNYRLIDGWTILHFLFGIALTILFKNWLLVVGLMLGYELLEYVIINERVFNEREYNTNVLGDILFTSIGIIVGWGILQGGAL